MAVATPVVTVITAAIAIIIAVDSATRITAIHPGRIRTTRTTHIRTRTTGVIPTLTRITAGRGMATMPHWLRRCSVASGNWATTMA